jgi:hypothetical protein
LFIAKIRHHFIVVPLVLSNSFSFQYLKQNTKKEPKNKGFFNLFIAIKHKQIG